MERANAHGSSVVKWLPETIHVAKLPWHKPETPILDEITFYLRYEFHMMCVMSPYELVPVFYLAGLWNHASLDLC